MSTTLRSRLPLDDALARIHASPALVDLLVALGLTLLALVTVVGQADDIGGVSGPTLLFLFGQTLPIVVLRRAPLPVLAATVAATMGQGFVAQGPVNATFGSLVALFAVTVRYERRISSVAASATGLAFAVVILARAPNALGNVVQTSIAVLVVWLLGTWARDRRAYVGLMEERARRLEADREEDARRAVAEERQRIARELHDVVTHHVSVIVIQAGAGIRALDRRPAEARDALAAIDTTARQALTDMRRMLGILGRAPSPDSSGPGVPDGGDGLAPMPGLDRLGELLEQVRVAGLPVELTVTGERRPLDPGIELSAYRIVQEALTNTLKHASGARAHVAIDYGTAAIVLEVRDDGGAGRNGIEPHGEPGHGLIGMRERAALFGGSLDAGPDGRGFRVVARLPLAAGTVLAARQTP